MTVTELQARIDALPRARFGLFPTPLEQAPNLSRALGGPRIFIKREDCTGLAFGGNKTRQFEFGIGDALALGADCIVTGASSQSNHCRQAAAACARLGLPCHLVLKSNSKGNPRQGNLLLMELLGADIQFVECAMGPELDAHKQRRADELSAAGKNPYVLSSERGNPPNAVGYVNMIAELVPQLEAAGVTPTWLFICSAGPTGAGTLLGSKLLIVPWKTVFISPIVWPFSTEERMAHMARGAAQLLGLDSPLTASDFDVRFDYIGESYGTMSAGGREAIELLARTEGIILDPVYSGKALAGLIDFIRTGQVGRDDTVVFVHTGGTPALFAFADEFAA